MTVNYQFHHYIISQILGVYWLLLSIINLFNQLVFHAIRNIFLMVKTLCSLSSKPYPPKKIDLVVYYNSLNYPDELKWN